MLDNQTLVHDKKTNTVRPIVVGDIAILSRTWEPLEVYGEALESVAIPVALAGGGNLLNTREAKDAWALLRFLADTSDDLALVAVLRSPFFAMSDRVLFTFIQNQENTSHGESKFDWWKQIQKSTIPELQRPVTVLNKILQQRNLESPTRLLLELTQKQRSLKAERLLQQIIGNTKNEVIFLEHLEILFDTSLQLDPLRCLQKLARNCTIVAVWSGKIENNHLIYAEREHPEYKSYLVDGFLVINLE